MMTMLVMAIVVVASPVVASDSFDRKRSMDFAHWTDPFPQITPTFLTDSLRVSYDFRICVTQFLCGFAFRFTLVHFAYACYVSVS